MAITFFFFLFFFSCDPQQLESVWWMEDGHHLLSSHSDGSYCRWVVGEGEESDEEEKSDIPYGKSGQERLLSLSLL